MDGIYLDIPRIVKELKKEEKLGLLNNGILSKSVCQPEKTLKEINSITIKSIDNLEEYDTVENTIHHESTKLMSDNITDIVDLIKLIENITIQIQNHYDKEDIFKIVADEFKKSPKFSVGILLLSDDEKKLRVAATSEDIGKIQRIEKKFGTKTKNFRISFKKSDLYKQVLFEGETIHVKLHDVVKEIFPLISFSIILKMMKFEDDMNIITPLYKNNKIIGVLAVTSPVLGPYCIPSVKNLSHHITIALEKIEEQKRIDQLHIKIKESEEKYRLIFENANDEIVYLNKKGIIIDINSRAKKFTGLEPEELIGKKWSDLNFFKKKDIPQLWKFFKDVAIHKKSLTLKHQKIFRKDGSVIIGDVSVRPVIKEGKIDGIVAIVRDVTEYEKTVERAQEYNERYHALFDNSLELVYITDFKGNFIDANKACFELLGYTKEELKNLNFGTFLDKRQLINALKILREVKKTGAQQKPSLFKLKCRNGEYVYVETMSSLIFNDGKPVAMQGIARNITEHEEYKEELEKLAKIVQYSGELVNLATLDGRMIFLNEAGSKMLGIDPSDVKNHTILDVIPDDLIDMVKTIVLPSIMKEGSWDGELQYKNILNDKITSVHAMTFLIKHPETKDPLYFANVSLDITNQKKAEIELQNAHQLLKEMNIELEQKVEERTGEIKLLLIQKDEFINQLGHDLKNPLGPLVNLLPMLEKEVTDPKHKEMLEVINRNVVYMKNLVIKTIELAWLNSPKTTFDIQELHLLTEINTIVDANKLLFDEEHIQILNHVSDDIYVTADKLRLAELFTNLFNNCVKYTNGSGKIRIDTTTDDYFVTISIMDNGIGMTEDQMKRIFNEFYKADSSRHDFDSSGLGMTICKRIVEMHGGRIWVESKGPGKGSLFCFTIPIVLEKMKIEGGNVFN